MLDTNAILRTISSRSEFSDVLDKLKDGFFELWVSNEIVLEYEEKITDLISKLDVKTQRMTQKGIEKAEKSGLVVEIEWIPVQFADRTAMIDPIRVMNW